MSVLSRFIALGIFIAAFGFGHVMGEAYTAIPNEEPVIVRVEQNVPFPESQQALREMAADMMRGGNLQDIEPASGEDDTGKAQ
jgi:hypothetical protein